MPRFRLFGRNRAAADTFESLVRPHMDFLHRLAWRFSGNTADAEDLVQDLLVKLYRRRDELLDVEQLRPWLAKALYRGHLDLARARARSPVATPAPESSEEGDPPEAPAAEEDGPDRQAERAEWRGRLVVALGQLNPEQRAVVALHDAEGYTLEELESILQAPLGTLKSRLHRARQRLRSLLGMEPFGDAERVKR